MKWLFALVIGFLFGWLPMNVYAQDGANLEESVIYRVVFSSTWSAETHPGFPAGAHFSPLIGATHHPNVTFWISGTLASPGMEQMAETGGTSILRQEIAAAGSQVHALITGPGMATSPGQVATSTLAASLSHPHVTLVTMIAPSPDWFVGVHGLSLLDEQGRWRDQLVVTLYPYDAGTDDGADYTSADVEPTPHHPIGNLRGQTPFSAEPIGAFIFTRLHQRFLPIILN
jgi:hypothetical protein